MVPPAGLEPATRSLKDSFLPLNYGGLVRERRFELLRPSSLVSKTSVATVTPLARYDEENFMVSMAMILP